MVVSTNPQVTALDEIISEASELRKKSDGWGNKDHFLYLAMGVAAVIAGVLAGASGAADWPGWVTALAGFSAAVLAGLQTFLTAEERALFHFNKGAEYFGVQMDAVVLKGNTTMAEKTRQAQLSQLAGRLSEIKRRPFKAEVSPARMEARERAKTS